MENNLGNKESMAQNIKRFMNCTNKKELGSNARVFYEKYFERIKFMNRLEEELRKQELING